MTRLTLLRHAKSSWDHSDMRDIDRPLNDRGRRDAPMMGLVCAEHLSPPDIILLSPARRTRETIDAFTEAWGLDSHRIIVDERLYLAGISDWVDVVGERASGSEHVLGCAHQPGIGDFARWLDPGFSDDVPTAAVMSFKVTDIVGDGLTQGCGELTFRGIPREFRRDAY